MSGFDPKCLELAEYFLPDKPAAVQYLLAQDIQDAIEAFGGDGDECYCNECREAS